MNPIPPNPSVRHDLYTELTTLLRAIRAKHVSDQDRLRMADNIVTCIRVRLQDGEYGLPASGRGGDFMRALAWPNPN